MLLHDSFQSPVLEYFLGRLLVQGADKAKGQVYACSSQMYALSHRQDPGRKSGQVWIGAKSSQLFGRMIHAYAGANGGEGHAGYELRNASYMQNDWICSSYVILS